MCRSFPTRPARPRDEQIRPPRPSQAARRCIERVALLIAITASVAACGSNGGASLPGSPARIVDLPGAENAIDFDDIVYSPRLDSIIVPARRSGLYLIDPSTAEVTRLGHLLSADSADEGSGLIFVADRERRTITAVDARTGRTRFSFTTERPIDYVRYVELSGELWVTEPAASPPGIEVFTLSRDRGSEPRRSGFVAVPDGPEALTLGRRTAYTHAGRDLVAVDIATHSVTARWPTGCSGTHGFPQIDQRDGFALASCASDGTVSLLALDTGRQLGRYGAGGGRALPAYSRRSNHFYARGDPGTTLVTLKASDGGLAKVDQVSVPSDGHCLTADDVGHYWTCDADHGRVLRFDDP